MLNNLLKKWRVIGIIILFVGTIILPVTGIAEKQIKSTTTMSILYVGGSGPGNYTRIQGAIDNASDGDVIFVYNGIYFENIDIYKSVNLTGEDKNGTLIDGSGSGAVVDISEHWVNISGFTIQKSGSNLGHSGIIIKSDYNTIANNIISSNNNNGINIYGFGNNTIVNNKIISNSGYGIFFSEAFCNNIIGNNITLNTRDGIYIELGGGNLIIGNDISFNNIGITLFDSQTNVTSNNIFMNSWFGLHVLYEDSCIIYDNEIRLNVGCGIGLIESNYHNIISNTIIFNHGHGIYLNISSYNNIKGNIICLNSGNGILLDFYGDSNLIYHNNFLNNTQNAFDEFNNTWYCETLREGNYWDDYNGTDDDGDGIGDTPYDIPGGDNQDLYPLMDLYGLPIADFIYYPTNRTFDGSLSYDDDGFIVLYEWDFDDGSTGKGEFITHVYNVSGVFNVTLTVTDDDGFQDNITKSVKVVANYPPGIPLINGQLKGKKGKKYSYTFISEDFNEDDIFYNIDWGDGNISKWFGPFPSNQQIIVNHSWSDKGTYKIMARAKDIFGAIGEWGTLEVKMPKIKLFIFNFPLLNWLSERFPNVFLILRYMLGL